MPKKVDKKVPKEAVGADTRARILDEAAQLFQERGYDGTSMNAIADRIGITAAGLYWHFDSKEDILFQALESAQLDLIHATGQAVSFDSPEDQLRAFTTAHVRFQLERLDVSKLFGLAAYGVGQLTRSLPDEQRLYLDKLQRKHYDNCAGILEAGTKSGAFVVADVAATTFAILAMGEHVIYWYHPGGRLTPEQLGDLYAELAVRMVASRESTAAANGDSTERPSSTPGPASSKPAA